ncbi:putative IMPACT (imprinted ancient) family translation regulator [Mycoplasmoides fastidiosum]|uniref:IMPACT (Imprinted ancient) family translation regulator n=1 Tax=Mycoplasmoides fastidiosum TaxID=92758 RepID=A0ABU0LZL8_9BACT|nr:YigZ family protein [Mycoplasmoides fastidiosum]MDQ0514128.1 putative IMPACT (imprinted ancient) family translation regulator [Mycoplasmoides fastidiosum]UUD37464.1 YigZ family protein [Mycoplasmoides fastidiosum]
MHLHEVKKSKFYAQLYPVTTKTEITKILQELKRTHKKARHICYAFYLKTDDQNFISGLSDAGEPKGVAGKNLFNLLVQHQKINYLLVVVRYFGGVKLGYGGLFRAYLEAAKLVFEV